MPDETKKPKRGRPPKVMLRTPSQFNDVILKVANSPKAVAGPTGVQEISFYELNVINASSDKPSVRLGATNFVHIVNRAAVSEENRKRLEESRLRQAGRY